MTPEPPRRARWVFWAILSILFIDRFGLLWRFGFRYTDNDQVFFWLGAKDYAHGVFHEPCLYGQNYNYMLESFLAAPFFRLGVPCWYLFPVVTSALALAPYLGLAFYFLKRDLLAACVFVALPILLPVEFGMLTTISRGFVTGLGLVALFPLACRLKSRRGRLLALGLIGGAAVLMNPNAAPAVATLILVTLLRDPFRSDTWIYPLVGTIPFLALAYLVSLYYSNHLLMLRLSASMVVFHPGLCLDGIRHLDRYFAWLCPVFWTHGSLVLILLLAQTAVLAGRRRWRKAGALLAATGIMVVALGMPKIHDGDASVVYAYSRMFLAAPLLLGIGFSFCSDLLGNQKAIFLGLLLICVGAALCKTAQEGAIVQKETLAGPPIFAFRRIKEVRHECATIRALCRGNTELIVALPPLNCTYADASFDCVAGETMFPDYPRTLIYTYDRRSWRLEAELKTISSNILFIGGGQQGWQKVAQNNRDVSRIGNGIQIMHRFHNTNGLTLRELLLKLGPVMQPDQRNP